MDERDLQMVREAFDLLVDYVAKSCDPEYAQAIYWAKDDILSILAGTWQVGNEPAEEDEAALFFGAESMVEESDRPGIIHADLTGGMRWN